MIFIGYSNVDFNCPHCNKQFANHDYYVKKVYNALGLKADVKCSCKKNFKLGINHIGKFQTFK